MNNPKTINTLFEKHSVRSLLAPAFLGLIGLSFCLTPSATANSILVAGVDMEGQVTQLPSDCVASPPNLIVDPDFTEGCDVSGLESAPGYWGINNSAGLYMGGITGFPCCAAESFYLPDPGGTSAGSISQLVDTTPGQTYEVDFMLATNDVAPNASITVRFANTVGLFETNAELGLSAYQYAEYSFTAPATDLESELAVIGVGSTATPGYVFYATDFSVIPVSNSPEPSNLVLFATGIALIGAGGIRRRKSTFAASR